MLLFPQPSNSRLVCTNQVFQYITKRVIFRSITKVFPLKIFQQLTPFQGFDHQHHHSTYHLGLVGRVQKRKEMHLTTFSIYAKERRSMPARQDTDAFSDDMGEQLLWGRLKTYHLSRFATVAAIIFNTPVFQSGLGLNCCTPSKSMIWVIESCLRASVFHPAM